MPQQSDELRLLRHIADLRFEEELRGYSKSQVDRVLQKLAPLADEFETLHQKLADAETRVASAEARLLERTGTESDVIAPPSAPTAEQAVPSDPVPSDPVTNEVVPSETVAPQPQQVAAAPETGGAVTATPADFDETLRKTLVLAQRTADETVKEAYDEADRITNNAHSEADLVLGKAKNEAEEIETQSEQRRLELQAELDAEREQRLTTINSETETRRVELETALVNAEGSERAELLEQIADLQQVRTMLSSDIESLEGHLAARREIIQTALDEVANVLEDPDRLRSGATPEVSAVAPVTAGDYTDVGIDIDAELATADGESSGSISPSSESSATEIAATGQPAGAEAEGVADVEDDVEELPELPQRRKAATLGEAGGAPATSGAEPVSAAMTDEAEEADDDSMVSISEALPSSIDDTSGPAPDAAGPPTEEFSFADVESDLASDTSATDTSDEPAPPEPVASATPPAPAPLTYEESSNQEESADPWVDDVASADGGFDSHDGLPDDEDAGGRPAWMDAVPDDVADGPPPPPPPGGGQDPFLDQLRKATNEESPDSDEALDRFLDGDDQEEGEKRPWFGRRR